MSIYDVWPEGMMALLTQKEADVLSASSHDALYDLYRNCSLAVLNTGSITDNSKYLLGNAKNFEINVVRNERGLKIELINPPEAAIVDGHIIKQIRKHLYAVLRDIVLINSINANAFLKQNEKITQTQSEEIADYVFMILRNAGVLIPGKKPNIAVCFGGHSIPSHEYDYAYKVGHELGLRKIDVCTGCGPGVMEAPMKGAILGFTQQCAVNECRLIGLTEPSIIAAEPPNLMVSDLVILPDIEKRLEAFVRLGHSLIIFPGGPGTAEELLYLLTIKLCPENKHSFMPIILTGSKESEDYFKALDEFLITCLGHEITRYYDVIIDDPVKVAKTVSENNKSVLEHRTLFHDSYSYNWSLNIPYELKVANDITHEFMASLNLSKNQAPQALACALRSAFSGIVCGNVKEQGINAVKNNGPFKLHGDPEIIAALDKLLTSFIDQGRILINTKEYKPCYVLE